MQGINGDAQPSVISLFMWKILGFDETFAQNQQNNLNSCIIHL
jgi:hypothetical protein